MAQLGEKPMEQIREQIAETIYKDFMYHPKNFKIYACADQILSITLRRGGGVCPECYRGKIILDSRKFGPAASYPCPKCNGTGKLPVEEKSIKDILKEWQNGQD